MTNVETLRPVPTTGNGMHKLQHNTSGLRELLEMLDEIYNALRGANATDLQALPAEKTPNALLDIVDTQARYLARCHQTASDIRKIVL